MQKGHCADSRVAVHNTMDDAARLVRTYFYYMVECVRKDFPSLDFLRKYFAGSTEKYGGYIDYKGEIAPAKRMAFLGCSECRFTTSQYNIHQVWVRHSSRVDVRMADNSHLHLDCFEKSEVVIHILSPGCRVIIHQYAGAKVTLDGYTECASITKHESLTYK